MAATARFPLYPPTCALCREETALRGETGGALGCGERWVPYGYAVCRLSPSSAKSLLPPGTRRPGHPGGPSGAFTSMEHGGRLEVLSFPHSGSDEFP